MAYKTVEYSTLKEGVNIAIKNLFSHHQLPLFESGQPNLNDILRLIRVKEERGLQALFLHLIASRLENDEASDEVKALILTAACYFVIERICASYQWISPKKSTLYCALTSLLNLSDTKSTIPEDDLVVLYRAIERFIGNAIYESKGRTTFYNPRNPFIVESVTKFSILELHQQIAQRLASLEDKNSTRIELVLK